MNNHETIEALRSVLEYVRHTTNLEDPMLHEIDNAVRVLDQYISQFDPN